MSRTTYAAKNVIYGILSKIISLLVSFVSRTVFVYCMGKQFLGINGLYSEILSVLSFAELGFGTAIVFSLYEPVAKNDRQKIVQLLSFYKKIYRIIMVIISLVGLSIMPFLQNIVQGATISLFHLRFYFLLFLINTIVGYTVAYKYSYLSAAMKNYIETNITTVVNLAVSILQISVLAITKNYSFYLLTHTFVTVVGNIIIIQYLNRKYPIIKEKAPVELPKEDKQKIYKEVKGLAVHKLAGIAVHSTDNIIISSASQLGVMVVGTISNYTMLITSVTSFISMAFNNLTSIFGNLLVSTSQENYRKTFLEMNFLNFWLYGFSSIAFFVLIPPFIELWLGASFLADNFTLFLIVVNSFLLGQATLYNNVRTPKGNFNKDKMISFVQALVNLVVSIIMVRIIGLPGVFVGTVVSRLSNTILRPIVTYRYLFGTSCMEYFKAILRYFLSTVLAGVITYFAAYRFVTNVNILNFAIAIVIVAIVPNLIFLIIFYKSPYLKMILNRVKKLIKRRKRDEQATVG